MGMYCLLSGPQFPHISETGTLRWRRLGNSDVRRGKGGPPEPRGWERLGERGDLVGPGFQHTQPLFSLRLLPSCPLPSLPHLLLLPCLCPSVTLASVLSLSLLCLLKATLPSTRTTSPESHEERPGPTSQAPGRGLQDSPRTLGQYWLGPLSRSGCRQGPHCWLALPGPPWPTQPTRLRQVRSMAQPFANHLDPGREMGPCSQGDDIPVGAVSTQMIRHR